MPARARTSKQRFPLLISPLWRLILRPFGVTPERSYAELAGGKLHVRYGRFDYLFPLEDVESVSLAHWPLWAGIGPRYFRGSLGLTGTYVNTVEVRFNEPQAVRMLVPVRCRRLYLSLEEPRDFMGAVTKPALEAKAA